MSGHRHLTEGAGATGKVTEPVQIAECMHRVWRNVVTRDGDLRLRIARICEGGNTHRVKPFIARVLASAQKSDGLSAGTRRIARSTFRPRPGRCFPCGQQVTARSTWWSKPEWCARRLGHQHRYRRTCVICAATAPPKRANQSAWRRDPTCCSRSDLTRSWLIVR